MLNVNMLPECHYAECNILCFCYAECHYAECKILCIVTLNVIMLSVVMLNDIILSVMVLTRILIQYFCVFTVLELRGCFLKLCPDFPNLAFKIEVVNFGSSLFLASENSAK